MADLEELLNERDSLLLKKENSNKECDPFTAKQMLRADKGASLSDFISMVGLIVEYVMDDMNITFIPDENKKNFIEPDVPFNHAYITYKVLSRKTKNEYKPIVREEIIEDCDGQARPGLVKGIRFECKIQFNIFASEYKLANKVMDTFEELMISYAGHLKKQGVVDLFFTDQHTDSEYNTFRETMSVRNLEYYVEIEKLMVIFNEKIKDIPVFGDVVKK